MRIPKSLWVIAPTIALIASPSHSQVGGETIEVLEVYGTHSYQSLGRTTASAGDVNGDGYDDIIANSNHPGLWTGKVQVYSGIDGDMLHEWLNIGRALAGIGDINGDGHDDVIVGNLWDRSTPTDGKATAYSGIDGSPIYTLHGAGGNFGSSVSGAGDVNNDGTPDFIIGAPRNLANGLATGASWVYSGIDGSVLLQINGQQQDGGFGSSVSGLRDINGDGHDDLIVGEPGFGGNHEGATYVFSGADGAQIFRFHGASQQQIGKQLGDAGDVNADGTNDILCFGDSVLNVYSGSDGTLLNSVTAFGGSSAGDLDNDGYCDFVVIDSFLWGAPLIYSGLSGQPITRIEGHGHGPITLAGDVNGDGRSDLVVTSTQHSPPNLREAGRLFTFNFSTFQHLNSSTISATSIGDDLVISMHFPQSEAGQSYAVLASVGGTGPTNLYGLDLPLTQDFIFDKTTRGQIDPNILHDGTGILDSNAKATATLFSGNALLPLLGSRIYIACVTFDANPHQGRLSSSVASAQVVL